MKKEKLTSTLAIILLTSFYSNVVWAAEDTGFSVSIWPFVLLGIVLLVFRKKIIAEATVSAAESDADSHKTEKVVESEAESQSEATVAVSTPATPVADDITDLTQHVEQCQGTTAKGTRCSRTANLEPIVVKVENKQYRFLTCKQHNNEGFIPFHFR